MLVRAEIAVTLSTAPPARNPLARHRRWRRVAVGAGCKSRATDTAPSPGSPPSAESRPASLPQLSLIARPWPGIVRIGGLRPVDDCFQTWRHRAISSRKVASALASLLTRVPGKASTEVAAKNLPLISRPLLLLKPHPRPGVQRGWAPQSPQLRPTQLQQPSPSIVIAAAGGVASRPWRSLEPGAPFHLGQRSASKTAPALCDQAEIGQRRQLRRKATPVRW